MGFEIHTCVVITCDNGCSWEDDDYSEGTPHFDTREEAVAHARRCGYLVTDGRVLCRDCARKADCAATGHQWESWRDHAHDGLRYRVRGCEHCNTSDYDPPFERLREQRRAVDDAETLLASIASQHGEETRTDAH